MVRLQCPLWALAAPAPHDFHRPLSTLFASDAFRSTDVFWPVPPRMLWVALIRTLLGQAYWSEVTPSLGASQLVPFSPPRSGRLVVLRLNN